MHAIRFRFGIVVAVLFLLSACGAGGGGPGGGGEPGTPPPIYATTSISISVGGSGATAQSIGLSFTPQTFVGTFADVAAVTVAVSGLDRSGIPRNPLAVGILTLADGVWSGTIADLPVGPELTFTARGDDSTGLEIFSGVTVQTLTGLGDSVAVAMDPVDNGTPIAFPIVASITRPAEVAQNASAAVRVAVVGSPGETLTYALTPAGGGGSFFPAAGSIPLETSGTGTIVITYTAPAAIGIYTHSVRVTNAQGNAVETDFSIGVVAGETSPSVQVSFAPAIGPLLGKRTGNSVAWTATASDDGPPGALTYAWSFAHTGGTTGSSFTTANANPGIQSGYDQTVTGTVSLTVTDGDARSTTITFALVPGQFPDGVVVSGGGGLGFTDGDGISEITDVPSLTPSPFGPGDTLTVSVPVDSDAGVVFACIVAQLTDDFMSGLDRGCGEIVRTPSIGTALVPVVADPTLPASDSYWIVVFTTVSQAAADSQTGTVYLSVGGSSTYFRQQWTAGVVDSSSDTGVAIPTFSSPGGTLPPPALTFANGDGLAELAGTPTLSAPSVTIGVDASIVVYVPVDSDTGSLCVTVGQAWNTGNGDPPWLEQGSGCASFPSGTAQTQPVTVWFSGLTPGTLSIAISVGLETPWEDNTNSSWVFASTNYPGLFRVVKYPGSPVGVEMDTDVPIPTFTAVP